MDRLRGAGSSRWRLAAGAALVLAASVGAGVLLAALLLPSGRSRAATPAPVVPAPPAAPAASVTGGAAISVRGDDGRLLPAAGVVSFASVAREGGVLVLRGVSVLGGRVTADELAVPDQGFAGARVEGLRVDGVPRLAGTDVLHPLRGGGYVVVLQEAVSGGRQGLVALRVHVERGLGPDGGGGDVLVGATGGAGTPARSVLALGPSPAVPAAPGYPLATRGVVIGCPLVPGSAHSPTAPPDNLASDNAVDLAVPVGTPVLAVADGTIGSLIGPLESRDPHLAGLRVHLDTPTEHYYYAHLSRIDVVPGQRVRAGQVIGLSGRAAGVAHLHFAQDHGDPAATVGETAACPRRPRPHEPWG